jgi:hypothetical protein
MEQEETLLGYDTVNMMALLSEQLVATQRYLAIT